MMTWPIIISSARMLSILMRFEIRVQNSKTGKYTNLIHQNRKSYELERLKWMGEGKGLQNKNLNRLSKWTKQQDKL